MMSSTNLSPDDLERLCDVFRLLGEPNRLRLVLTCLDGEMSVGDLCEALTMPQTLASHHLRLLRSGRILRSERRGRQVRYDVDDGHVRAVLVNMVAHFIEPHEQHSAETSLRRARSQDGDGGDGDE